MCQLGNYTCLRYSQVAYSLVISSTEIKWIFSVDEAFLSSSDCLVYIAFNDGHDSIYEIFPSHLLIWTVFLDLEDFGGLFIG